MTSRYRVEYSLKSHRRDEFIEWIKALLATPFVLHSDAENQFKGDIADIEDFDEFVKSQEFETAKECQKRYYEVFEDVERLVRNTIDIDNRRDHLVVSRLRRLVPSVGTFFTPLPLTEAFLIEDRKRCMSKRRFVSPSFNDIRHILNTAQVLALASTYKDNSEYHLKLITFDGDVTLYDDGKSLAKNDDVVKRLIELLGLGFFIGVVTAAGYPGQQGSGQYYSRLKGLIDAINESELTAQQRENLLVMGGESNYLFRYSNELKTFKFVDSVEWYTPLMKGWDKDHIEYIMENMYKHMIHLRERYGLDNDEKTMLIKKERSIGIIPVGHYKILRETLEEIVLSCSVKLNEVVRQLASNIKVCAFNGGSDVWVDIGDKSLGVESLQSYLCKDETLDICPILKSETLHVGDQFASLGANDFKARLSACTAWIAKPKETVDILDQLLAHIK